MHNYEVHKLTTMLVFRAQRTSKYLGFDLLLVCFFLNKTSQFSACFTGTLNLAKKGSPSHLACGVVCECPIIGGTRHQPSDRPCSSNCDRRHRPNLCVTILPLRTEGSMTSLREAGAAEIGDGGRTDQHKQLSRVFRNNWNTKHKNITHIFLAEFDIDTGSLLKFKLPPVPDVPVKLTNEYVYTKMPPLRQTRFFIF